MSILVSFLILPKLDFFRRQHFWMNSGVQVNAGSIPPRNTSNSSKLQPNIRKKPHTHTHTHIYIYIYLERQLQDQKLDAFKSGLLFFHAQAICCWAGLRFPIDLSGWFAAPHLDRAAWRSLVVWGNAGVSGPFWIILGMSSLGGCRSCGDLTAVGVLTWGEAVRCCLASKRTKTDLNQTWRYLNSMCGNLRYHNEYRQMFESHLQNILQSLGMTEDSFHELCGYIQDGRWLGDAQWSKDLSQCLVAMGFRRVPGF